MLPTTVVVISVFLATAKAFEDNNNYATVDHMNSGEFIRKLSSRSPTGKFFIMKGELSDPDATDNFLDEILPRFLQSQKSTKLRENFNFPPIPQFQPQMFPPFPQFPNFGHFGPPLMPPPFFFPLGPQILPPQPNFNFPPPPQQPNFIFPPKPTDPGEFENGSNQPNFHKFDENFQNLPNLPKFGENFDGAVVVEKFLAVPTGDLKVDKANQLVKPTKEKLAANDHVESYEGTTKQLIKPNWIGKGFNCPCEPFALQKDWPRIRKCIKRCAAERHP